MENGTEIIAESHVQKENDEVTRVSEERLEEKTVLGSCDGLNEPEAEEVFEEAVETHEHLMEDGGCAKPSPVDHDISGEREGADTSDADAVKVEEIRNGGDEVEKFEEAIGVSDGVVESMIEEVVDAIAEEKMGDFVRRVSVDGAAVDEVAAEMEDLKNEVNGTCEEDSVKVISEIVADGERESMIGDNEVDNVLLKVIGNDAYEKDDAENVITEEVCTIEKLETGAALLDSHQASDSSEEISTRNSEDRSTDIASLVVEDRNVSAEKSLVTEDQNISNIKSEDAEDKMSHTEHQIPDDSDLKHSMTDTDSTRISDSVIPETNGEIHEPKSAIGNRQISTEDKEVTLEVVTPTFAEKSTTENHRAAGQSGQVRDVHVVSDNGIFTSPETKEETTPVVTRATNLPAQGIAPLPKKPTSTTPSQDKPTNSGSSSARPAGLGRGAHLLEPASRMVQQPRVNGTVSHTQNQTVEEPVNGDSEEYDETREKLQMIRVKFLRLAHRLGQTPHNVVVAQVLYRLGLAEQLRGRNGGRVGAFSFDHASAKAEQLEASGLEPLDFSCTIMVLGKTGVGKSATINSIFDEMKFSTDAFQMGTKKVQEVVGLVQGIKVRVIDTPGLLPSWSDQRQNEKTLQSVKRFISKTPPDIVLYLDRLDMQSRDFSDMPLLRTITETFGPSIWCNAIVVLTHAASAPPDGPNGTASSYDMFVTQRSHVVQQAIRQAASDMRLMNPVSLVENHSACRTNRNGQRVLPNGQVWKPHLLLLSFASKILAEANALLKLQDNPPGKPFTARSRAPPLPYLLSSLLQSRPQLKLPEEQYGGDDTIDDDLDESSDSDDEAEYDELPPFTSLTKSEVAKLSGAQKKAYFDEVDYRERLLMKKQLKEEKTRRRMMKKMAAELKDLPSEYAENPEDENQPSVPMVPMPDLALPASFDSDYPTHRYRSLDSSKWLVRPVLETHGWDHDIGYEGINVDRLFVVKDKVPLSVSGQVTKDKKDANLQLEVASSVKHGKGKATSFGFDMLTHGKDLAYTLRSETRFANFRKNKATAGISATLLGDALSGGIKLEDKLIANKRFQMLVTGGAMAGRGEVAYGGSLEAQLRDKDHPFGRSLSTLGISVMDWHGDLAIGGNLQTQIPVGRNSNLVARANLNNRGSGQISIRLTSSEQLQIALVALVPIIKRLLAYPQQWQSGQ